ncbi:MAG: pilus assembly protein PilM [Phycisphaerales bacterium JB040]
MKSIRGSAPPVAIDFGVSALKVLQLTGTTNPSLVAASQLDTPEELLGDPAGRLRYQIESLPRVMRSGGFKSQRAVFSVPAGQMFCKHLQMQKIDGVRPSEMVAATIAQQMECDPKALIVRSSEVRQVSANKTEIVCFALGRPMVDQLMMAVKNAKLEPVGIHTEVHALLKGAGISAPGESGEPPCVAHIDIGSGSTKVVVARGEQILFARIVGFGGLRLDRAIAKQTQLTLERARAKRLALTSYVKQHAPAPAAAATVKAGESNPSFRPQRPVEADFDLTEPMEIFADELRMCLRYHRSLSPSETVERIVFTGGEARHAPLCAHLAEALRLPAQVADPLARVGRSGREPVSGLTLSAPQPGWAVAMGLALSPTDL